MYFPRDPSFLKFQNSVMIFSSQLATTTTFLCIARDYLRKSMSRKIWLALRVADGKERAEIMTKQVKGCAKY